MAMPPIVIVADLFARRGVEADRVRSEQSLLLLMEAMCAIDLLHLPPQAGVVPPSVMGTPAGVPAPKG